MLAAIGHHFEGSGGVEGFEHVCKVAMESENLVVSSNLKFPVTRRTKKATKEVQTHGYEVDLVGARNGLLVLASVKSFFGSKGVRVEGFRGLAKVAKPKLERGFLLFNEPDIQDGVVRKAAETFGYRLEDVSLRLYVGRFRSVADRTTITEHLKKGSNGMRPVHVFGLAEIMDAVSKASESKTYRNDPVVTTIKALTALTERAPKKREIRKNT